MDRLMLPNVLVTKVESLLASKSYEEVLVEIFKPENLHYINCEGMDLITKICECGLAFAEDHDSIAACSSSLIYIVQNYRPKEALICLLEQAEAFVHSEKFTCLLNPLQHVMLNLPKKREKTFSWVLSTLKSHIKNYQHIPHDLVKRLCGDENEALLLDQDTKVRSIVQTYKNYIYFYTPFVQQLDLNGRAALESKDNEAIQSVERQRGYLRDYLVDLLGVPLIHFDLEWKEEPNPNPNQQNQSNSTTTSSSKSDLYLSSNGEVCVKRKGFKPSPKIKTDFRLMAEQVMDLLSVVDLNPSYYFDWIEHRISLRHDPKPNQEPMDMEHVEDSEDELEDEEIVINMSSIVGYFYLIYVQKINLQKIPSVLSPTWIFNTLLTPITTLLKNVTNIHSLRKAIGLCTSILNLCDISIPPISSTSYNYNHRFHHDLLKTELHSTFISRLAYICVYCGDKQVRDGAYWLLQKYILAFDPQGKKDFLNLVFNTIPNDSLQGHMVSTFNHFISIGLGERGTTSLLEYEEMEKLFSNRSIHNLVLMICNLKHGVTTDLCENNNKIISALNLLRYLLLRDGKENKTGIIEIFPRIETILLHPLRKAIDISKAHYELKLKEFNDPYLRKEREKEEQRMFESLESDFKIGDKVFKPGDISVDEQKSSLVGAINTFEHMKGLLAWLYEAHPSYSTFKKS